MPAEPIVIERTFDAPVSKVWNAISDKDEMKNWYFQLAEFKPEVGFQFQFTGGPEDGVQYVHLCEITEVVPEKRLAYSWRYKDMPGTSLVRFELEARDNKTLLRLTHTGFETFASGGLDFKKENFMEGWNHIVNKALKDYVEDPIQIGNGQQAIGKSDLNS